MNKLLLALVTIVFIGQTLFAQDSFVSATLAGKVTNKGSQIPYVSVSIKGTTIGTSTDEKGSFRISNIKPGFYTVQIQSVGFKPYEEIVDLETNENLNISIELESDVLGLEEVVVTGNRSRIMRKKASSIVNIINTDIFQSTQSVTLSEGLNFCSGLRMENDCQNCGFSQIRMNGLEGPYSQILINSRPIFSGLAGVYGLELIPTNMIEKVEVIRGGGSALYGSNAIAGTINLLLKDPTQDSYEVGVNNSFIGVGEGDNTATDYSLNFNASVVGENDRNGISIYGFHRNRKPFDANNDTFSEIASLNNTTLGSRMFHKLGSRAKVSLDFFHINEERRGGNKFNVPNHEADISEAVEHHLTTAAVTFEQYYRDNDLFSIFASGQKINRDSYYGAEQSLSDYGNTKDFTFNTGVQYNAKFENSELVSGIENTYSKLTDKKLGYAEFSVSNLGELVETHYDNTIVSDQKMNTFGVFSQYDIRMNKFKLSLGARFDTYKVEDKEKEADDKTGNVFSPRVNLLYDIQPNFQARVSYSAGYRAPQIFDEDLHIETSGSRKVIHVNAPNLEQETSDSFMASLDYNKTFNNNSNFGLLVEGFYTKLNNPFVNEFSDPDADGVVTYLRVNANEGATVKGVNLELNYVPNPDLKLKAGYTIQTSEYEEAQEFDEKSFFRTPDSYGFFTADWEATDTWCVIGTGTFTGKMLVPYFGADLPNPEEGELRKSDSFLDLGLKITKTIKLKHNSLEISGGMKNIFNSYQEDFDSGIDRDPAYIYGPMNPRTVYVGLKFGNILN
ncbi:outer membrane receptor for ferrienterochelin and colicins [Lutibacter oricola]|uniref:Outer membrane receptor for ferrienterochelin and colicins n=1 Tax=Lutibacter oricola TaxID=762486 RepID=A0A1H3GAA6_9FLAO|nr:TonB-dependent receptor [Lutibacter oricola]SDX99578.1 outer membrane receptor for ferrienterochelin and colicins [Lutibacter oricola]